ncbi:MAG: SDR family NAD(P)-dependent oxidoreductase, partial [Paracoccus sp. (in: a-proteobacteria)]
MRTDNQAAIVTGGASGLGGATARMLAGAGAKVAILDLNDEAGQAMAQATGGIFVRTDVTDAASVADAMAQAEARHGIARILVNCAGIAPPAKVVSREGEALALEEFSKVIAVNLLGSFNTLSQFAARLHGAERIEEETGVIVNTASVAAFDGQIGQAAYAA